MSDVTFKKIKSITRKPIEHVYDIQTKKNHNFFANSLLAHNCLIFQEDVMELAEVVGGFPKDQCDNVRRAIMKRDLSKGEAAMKEAKKMEDEFVAGAVVRGVAEQTARKSYQQILWFAGYGFNKCVTVDSEIDTYRQDGSKIISCARKRLKDVLPGDLVMSRDETTKMDTFVKVKQLHLNGRKKVVQVKLKSGEVIRCTMDHKFRTEETMEMLPLSEILERKLSIVVRPTAITATAATGASRNEVTPQGTRMSSTSLTAS